MCERTYECARPNHRHSCVPMWKGWIIRDILIIKRKLVPVERSESNGWMKRRLTRVKHVCRLDLFCFLSALCDRKIYQRLGKIIRSMIDRRSGWNGDPIIIRKKTESRYRAIEGTSRGVVWSRRERIDASFIGNFEEISSAMDIQASSASLVIGILHAISSSSHNDRR